MIESIIVFLLLFVVPGGLFIIPVYYGIKRLWRKYNGKKRKDIA